MLKYLVLFGAAIQLIGIFSYIRETVQGKTKPNRVTWCMWSVAPCIATAASLYSGVTWAVVPVFISGFGPLLVFIASFFNKNSYWKLGRFDYLCGFFSLLALILWGITKEPDIAIIFAILSDALAAAPTLFKAWKYPETETAAPFTLGVISALTSFAAIGAWTFSAYAFPGYLVVINSLISVAILRPKVRFSIKKGIGAIVLLGALFAVVYCFVPHSPTLPLTPLTPRTVAAEKVPDGWYEHMVELAGAPLPTDIVLTKHAVLPPIHDTDAPYDSPQIMLYERDASGTPEDYIAQEGLSGSNADVLGVKGTWGTFMGHRMFTIDLKPGDAVMLFGNGKVYTFILSSLDPSDATALWQVVSYYAQPAFFAGTSDWKTYTDPSTGFTMKYPPQYSIDAHAPQPFTADAGPPMYGWGSRTLLQIYDPASTSTGEFTIGPAQVTLQKQPIVASGTIYHYIVTYQNSGTAAQMVQGAPNPNGDLMTIASGEQGLFYSFPANPDTGADPGDDFIFIKNDLIYDVSFDANDPNEQGMLESIRWQQ